MDLAPMTAPASQPIRSDRLAAKAEEMEAAFLAEMLGHSGLGDTGGGFSVGEGETQFASFLRQEQARLMVAKGGIGLAELIFTSLVERSNDPA